MLVMDSPIILLRSPRSPAMNVTSTGKRRSRSPSASAAETPRNDDLLSIPIMTRTSTDDLCSTDAALVVALTSLSRGSSEMKTPVQEALTPYTKSSLTDDLTLPDLLRGASASDILTQRLQCTASMDELPLLTPNLGKFPSTISTCSDIVKPEPIRISDMNQTLPEIQVIDPSIAPLDMGRMESISGDATAITAENVTHANDEQNGDDEIARAAELIRAASETTEEEMPSLEDDGEQDVDKLESSARPHYHRTSLTHCTSLTVLPMVRTASNPDALPDEMNALATEENDVRAEQRVQEMLDQPDLLRNTTGNSINEEKRGIVSIDHLDSQLSLLHQHLDNNDTHKRRHYDPLIHVAIKRARIDESMSGYGKSGFKPVIRTNTSHFTSFIPSSSSIISPTHLIPSSSSMISPTHLMPTSIISPTHTLIPPFTRPYRTLSPPIIPTATNLTSLITASHSNAQRGASTSLASFSSTTSATPSQSAPVSTSSSPPPVARPVPKRRAKKPISPKSDTDSHSSASTSPSHSPRSVSSRDAVIAQSSHAEGDYECKECGKKFTTQSRMQIHYRTHGVGAKPFACEHCGQQFNHKGSLTRHIRTHGGEKPYECTICHKRFFQTGNLTVHFRTHTGEKPFECSECGKRFNHRSSLTVHFRGHF